MKRVRISSSSSMSPVISDYIFKEHVTEAFFDDEGVYLKVLDKFRDYLRHDLHDVEYGGEMSIENIRPLSNASYDCQFDAHVVFECEDCWYDVYASIRYNTQSGAYQFASNIKSKEI